MNIKDLCKKINENSKKQYSIEELKDLWVAIRKSISDVLVSGEEVVIPELVKFKNAKTAARIGRNPQTGKEIKIPAKRTVKAMISEKFKKSVVEKLPPVEQ